MSLDDFLHLAQVGLETSVLVSAPMLLMGLAAGLAVSIFQAATQINDGALAFIPKIVAVVFSLAAFGHFMINRLAWFTTWTISHIPSVTQ